jgi:hypothetical protein
MEIFSWGTALQALIIAGCTWYVRSGSKKHADAAAATVVRGTAAQSTSNDILARVTAIETDLALVKACTVKSVDDRGPGRQT